MQADTQAISDLKRALKTAVVSRFPSLREAAKNAGCSVDTVSRAVNGVQLPTTDTVRKILKACGNPPLSHPKYKNWTDLIEQARSGAERPSRQGAVSGKPRRESRKSADPQSSRRLYWFFLAGCGVGNRIAIMPTPPGGEFDESGQSFVEFIDALQRLGFTPADLRPFRSINDIVQDLDQPAIEEGFGEIILSYFALMNSVEHQVRELGHPDEFRWFVLGKLLYEVATFPLLEKSGHATEVNAVQTRIAAMSAVLESLELAESIKQSFRSFLETIERDNWDEEFILRANRLAVTCSLIL